MVGCTRVFDIGGHRNQPADQDPVDPAPTGIAGRGRDGINHIMAVKQLAHCRVASSCIEVAHQDHRRRKRPEQFSHRAKLFVASPRLAAHEAGKGAKYTRGRGPLKLVASRRCRDKGVALRIEHAIKKLARRDKLALDARRLGAIARAAAAAKMRDTAPK